MLDLTTSENLDSALELFFKTFGIERNIYSKDNLYHVVGRFGTDMSLVTVANMLGLEGEDQIVITQKGHEMTFPLLTGLRINPLHALCLCVNVKLSYGNLKYCISEIVPLDAYKREFIAKGEAGTYGEIAFDIPFILKINGRKVLVQQKDDLWIAIYKHDVEKMRLEILLKDISL